MKAVLKKYYEILKETFRLFIQNNSLKLSASLSYYTVFSICPFLIVIISLAGIFYGKQAVQGKVYDQISGLVGGDTAEQIQHIIQNIQKTHHSVLGSIIGFIILIIGASSVFSEIQDSLNLIWQMPAKKKSSGIIQFARNKLLSFSLIAGVAFILLVSLIVNALIDILNERLKAHFPASVIHLFYAANVLIIFLIIILLFAIIFKILPAAGILWKDAIAGAIFTAFFFLVGKFLIGFYLGNSRIGATYGTTASIVIIMLWVYYSSIILYFGAAFTKAYMTSKGRTAKPKSKTEKKYPLSVTE